jgi:hypothetical protein
VLTPVENSAFDELARQLSARLETENGNGAGRRRRIHRRTAGCARSGPAPPEWLAAARAAGAREAGATRRCSICCGRHPDLRLDRLLYANPLPEQMGYPNLHALEEPAASTRSMSNRHLNASSDRTPARR